MKSIIKAALIIVVIIGMVGFLNDATSGFYILKNSSNMVSAAFGIVAFGTIYMVGEICVDFINKKDKTSNSIIKRLFHLLIMFLVVVLAVMLSLYFFKII